MFQRARIIPFSVLLMKKTSAKRIEPTIKFSECTKNDFQRFIVQHTDDGEAGREYEKSKKKNHV